MEDQNLTNPPAGENPLNTTPTPEVPPVEPLPVLPEPSVTVTPLPAPAPSYSYAPAQGKETNPWAIVSLVSSILSWVGLFGLGGIVGVIAGIVARNQIRDSAGRQEGDGLALAGIIVGGANIFISCVGVLCMVLALAGVFSLPFVIGPNGR